MRTLISILLAFFMLSSICSSQDIDVLTLGDKEILIPVPIGFKNYEPNITEIDIPGQGKMTSRLCYIRLDNQDGERILNMATVLTHEMFDGKEISIDEFQDVKIAGKVQEKFNFSKLMDYVKSKYPEINTSQMKSEDFIEEDAFICNFSSGITENKSGIRQMNQNNNNSAFEWKRTKLHFYADWG